MEYKVGMKMKRIARGNCTINEWDNIKDNIVTITEVRDQFNIYIDKDFGSFTSKYLDEVYEVVSKTKQKQKRVHLTRNDIELILGYKIKIIKG
ncbi:MAG: hypothetical protein KAI79_01190 [Bacteroidales bacterium]|nr:hypothetical protein [Bacteroidales bacterium]